MGCVTELLESQALEVYTVGSDKLKHFLQNIEVVMDTNCCLGANLAFFREGNLLGLLFFIKVAWQTNGTSR